MRLRFDLSIIRQSHARTARYAEDLLAAMAADCRLSDTVITTSGWQCLRRAHRVLRVINLVSDFAGTTVGVPATAIRRDVHIWYSPTNLSSGLSRAQRNPDRNERRDTSTSRQVRQHPPTAGTFQEP